MKLPIKAATAAGCIGLLALLALPVASAAQVAGPSQMRLGASYSNVYGATADLGLELRDLFGRGLDLDAELRGGDEGQAGELRFGKTWKLGDTRLGEAAELSLGLGGLRAEWDDDSYARDQFSAEIAYEARLRGDLRWQALGFWQADRLYNMDPALSAILRQDAGRSEAVGLGLGLRWDSQPRRGLLEAGSTAQLGLRHAFDLGDDNRSFTRISAAYETVRPFVGQSVWSLSLAAGVVQGHGDTDHVSLLDRAFLGGRKPRGFASGSAGPRDLSTGDALGGTHYVTGSLEVLMPSRFEALVLGGFLDFGSSWDLPGVSGVDDGLYWRSSVGVSAHWQLRHASISLAYGVPLARQSYDETQRISVSLRAKY